MKTQINECSSHVCYSDVWGVVKPTEVRGQRSEGTHTDQVDEVAEVLLDLLRRQTPHQVQRTVQLLLVLEHTHTHTHLSVSYTAQRDRHDQSIKERTQYFYSARSLHSCVCVRGQRARWDPNHLLPA